ncbi:Bug family tripartite tricarboxylate transporter substrate binding protein [Falsiroseomonas sp. HW251]|uniref:Bug family tripartite tricarboxylate transporter substrate binding protein n=1 Tax=Falsiroseomonas sp. HW251 TaxID=3390998 RepID=UPI003D317036
MSTPPSLLRRSLVALALPAVAQAQPRFPSRPVRIVSGFAPGGATDVLARLMAERLSLLWRQPVAVENRPGAGGNIAAEYVARAAPDGLVLLLGTSAQVQSAGLFARLPYHPLRDFTPLLLMAEYPVVLVVTPSMPARSLAAFVDYARAHPGDVTMASSGIGNTPHLAALLLAQMAGIEFTHVQYTGAALAQAAVLNGEVRAAFQSMLLAKPAIADGREIALGTTGSGRWPELSDVPTIAEQGYPGYEAGSWFGIQAPPRMAPDLVAQLAGDLATAFRDPALRTRLAAAGFGMREAGPDGFARVMAEDYARWAEVLRRAGIPPE